jgi:hydroxymethylglutaryl-CoA lyase
MLNLRNFVRICDVTLRDGIQNLKSANTIFSKNLKNDIIYRLNNSNITNIEFGSNVSHKIKEMANTKDVLQSMNFDNLKSNLFLLVPNYNKYEELNSWVNINKVNRISLITACSETFVQKNTNMSLNENLDQIEKILNSTSDKKFRIYISTCFGCPFEGTINDTHLKNIDLIFNRFSQHEKTDELVISDTIGSYDMDQLHYYLKNYNSTNKLSLHIHSNSEDSNIKKIIEKYGDQLVSIDTSLGNLGGCPSVSSSKLKPNLSTLKVAYLINQITGKQTYDIDEILDLENLVRTTITSNQII